MGGRSSCHRKGEIITTVIVWLLLGAIVNVAVAWGCAWLAADLTAFMAHGFTSTERPHWYLSMCGRAGALRLFGFEPQPEQEAEWLATDGQVTVGPQPPRWSGFNAPPRGELVRVVEDARGWPMVALRSMYIARADSIDSVAWTAEWTGGIPLPPQPPANSLPVWEVRALPLMPIWPGFAINTIFYAAILWLLFAAPFALRRWRRIKRGLCPACAYPVGVRDVCTECGTAISNSVVREKAPASAEAK